MTQGFYSLEEAANVLGVAADELNRMAQRREVRAFADRGTWRFRSQDIDEMAQKQGAAAPSGGGSGMTGMGGGDALDPLDNPPALDDAGFDAPLDGGFDAPAPSAGVTGMGAPAPSSPSRVTTGTGGGGMDDISFEDISLEDLPMDEAPKTQLSPRKGETGIAGGGMDEDMIPLDEPPPMGDPSGESTVALGDLPAPSLGDTKPANLSGPPSSQRLALEQGSFEFDAGAAPPSMTKPPSSGKLGQKSSGKLTSPSSGRLGQGGDSDVRLDFDTSTMDDSMIPGPKGDSDVRLDPVSMVRGPSGTSPAGMGATEEIDLDAELQQADLASQARKPTTGGMVPPKTAAIGEKGTMLPTSSPFELSEDDLELTPTPSGSGGDYKPLGSEFELTLAPEGESSPLALGDDEDVDLGDLKPQNELSSSARAELSGINLHDPADSGISLEKGGGSSDSVDFELTVDEDATGPKTIKGKIPDSDSEFELTLEDSSASGANLNAESSDTAEQKDIFETDFDLPALEESGSQAVALEESDTDLESSDFDLALEEEGSSTDSTDMDDSASQVVILEEGDGEEEAPAPKKRKTRGFSAIHGESEGELLLDEDLAAVEDEADGDETGPATIPAAQAEWGWYPVLVLAPCVAVMFIAGLMAFELLNGMWGYHASTKPSGLVVSSMAKLFTDEVKE